MIHYDGDGNVFEETGEYRKVRQGEYRLLLDGRVAYWSCTKPAAFKYQLLRPIKRTYVQGGVTYQDVWEDGKPAYRRPQIGEYFVGEMVPGLITQAYTDYRNWENKPPRQIVEPVKEEEMPRADKMSGSMSEKREAVQRAIDENVHIAGRAEDVKTTRLNCPLCQNFTCPECPISYGTEGCVALHSLFTQYIKNEGFARQSIGYRMLERCQKWLNEHPAEEWVDVTDECEVSIFHGRNGVFCGSLNQLTQAIVGGNYEVNQDEDNNLRVYRRGPC